MRELLETLLSNRELLLACLLSGKRDFCNQCREAFRGMPVSEQLIEHCWYFILQRRGPGDIAEEFEWLQAQREVRDAALKAEADALVELGERAHGKLAAEEEGKFGRWSPHGEGL